MPNSHFTRQYNKVEVAGDVLIDLSEDTVDAGSLANGKTAHDRNGALITGAMVVNEIISTSVTIAVADWSSKTATKTVAGVTATNVVVIGGDPSTRDIFNAAGIYAYSQATDSITFKCDTTPTDDVLVNVMVINVLANADATSY